MNEAELLAVLDERTGQIASDVQEIKVDLAAHFVRRDEFMPVRHVVYGMVGLILAAVAGALVMLVVRGGG